MNNIFESLPNDKKIKIIDAAMEEFAEKGYDNASTNAIVKKAGISKGALFNYFGSKKGLFLYMFDYSVEHLMEEYTSQKEAMPSDLFERFVWLSLYKMKVFFKEPLISKLVVSAVINMPGELKDEISERYSKLYSKYIPTVLEGIDTSVFRQGINAQKAVELIGIFLDGLSNKYLSAFKNKPAQEILGSMNNILEEFKEYLDMLKYGMCKRQP